MEVLLGDAVKFAFPTKIIYIHVSQNIQWYIRDPKTYAQQWKLLVFYEKISNKSNTQYWQLALY